jgi:hypothetical protein
MTQENDNKIDARYQSIAYQLAKRISCFETLDFAFSVFKSPNTASASLAAEY